VQRAARPSRPHLPGAATSALLLGVQDDSSGKCFATAEPNQPSGLTATAVSSSQINLAWTADATPAPNEASYYDVERSPDGLGSWTSIGSTTSNSLSNTGLPAATQFYYRVTAYNCFGGSLPSATANATTQAATAPTAPTGVSASASTTAVAVTITWTDASTDETGFYVYRNTTNTTTGATLLSTLGAGVQTYTDNATNNPSAPPAIGTVYFYWVSAYNGVGESSKTAASQNATGAVTTLNVPAAPTSLTATATSTTQIDLAWTDNATNETGYTVERRSPAGSGSYSTVTTLSAGANSFSNTGLTESTQYEYRVYATNAAGNSANSNAASKFTIPATPTGLTATAVSSSQINLAWTDVSTGNTGQRIERRTPSGSGSYSTLTTVSATATTYSDTGLTASTSYEYRIVATNADYDSSPSTAANATTQSGALSPSWTLDFSSGTPSGYTLTRASSGTYVDSSGYIASAATDVARLTHNSSGTRLGLLVEEQRTQRAPNSELLTNWTNGGQLTRTTVSSITCPDGASQSASKLSGVNLSSGSAWYYTENLLGSGDYVFSVYAKADGVDFIYVAIAEATAGDQGRYFNLSNGTLGNLVGTLLSSSITSVGNGWYRCVVARNNPSTATNYPFVVPSTTNATGRPSQAGTSPDGVLVWGAQFEAANNATAYIDNTGTGTVTRSADLAHVLDSSITSWGDPGALVIHFYPPGQAGTLLSTDDVANEQLGLQASTTTAARAFWSSGNTATGTIGTGVQKAVHYWNGTNSRFCINGGTVQTGTNNITTFGNIDYVTFGAEATSSTAGYSQYANCIIRKIEFYSGTLTDANLQTITEPPTYNVEYLVIAGGGGGGGYGGGGAGGYRTATGFSLTIGTSYTVTVGAGGAGSSAGNTKGSNGSDSVFSTITSDGGGAGGSYSTTNQDGSNGGSGGGAGRSNVGFATGTAGTGVSGQGYAGGVSNTWTTFNDSSSGGGGGSGGVGGTPAASSGTGGDGGAGTASSITGTSVTRAGGGSGDGGTAAGNTTGGGGKRAAGSANTGGGGGGRTNNSGFAGGSGVVILRMATANYSGTTTGSPTVTTSGSDTILTFNASGSYTA
jgi:hypothetical protein